MIKTETNKFSWCNYRQKWWYIEVHQDKINIIQLKICIIKNISKGRYTYTSMPTI